MGTGIGRAVPSAAPQCQRADHPCELLPHQVHLTLRETPPGIQGSRNPRGGLGEKGWTSGGEERSKLRGESPRSESDKVGELGNSAAGEWNASSARLTASTATLRICKPSAALDAAEAFAIARAKLSCATSLSRLRILSVAVTSSPFRASDRASEINNAVSVSLTFCSASLFSCLATSRCSAATSKRLVNKSMRRSRSRSAALSAIFCYSAVLTPTLRAGTNVSAFFRRFF